MKLRKKQNNEAKKNLHNRKTLCVTITKFYVLLLILTSSANYELVCSLTSINIKTNLSKLHNNGVNVSAEIKNY